MKLYQQWVLQYPSVENSSNPIMAPLDLSAENTTNNSRATPRGLNAVYYSSHVIRDSSSISGTPAVS